MLITLWVNNITGVIHTTNSITNTQPLEVAISEYSYNELVDTNKYDYYDFLKALCDYGKVHREIKSRAVEDARYIDRVTKLKQDNTTH